MCTCFSPKKLLLMSAAYRVVLSLLLFNLFNCHLGRCPGRKCTALEEIRLGRRHQSVLPPRSHQRLLRQRLDWSSESIRLWCYCSSHRWLCHGRRLLTACNASTCWRIRCGLWVIPLSTNGGDWLHYKSPLSIFVSLGELGPGDNIGLVASKTSATSIRGQYYGIAAARGKIVHSSVATYFQSSRTTRLQRLEAVKILSSCPAVSVCSVQPSRFFCYRILGKIRSRRRMLSSGYTWQRMGLILVRWGARNSRRRGGVALLMAMRWGLGRKRRDTVYAPDKIMSDSDAKKTQHGEYS